MDDCNIVRLYLNRDEGAIKETENKYGRYLTKIAYNILNDTEDSKESVNDTYLAAWNSIPPHKPDVLSVYLSRITRRISIDIFRRKNRDKRKASQYALALDELYDCEDSSPSPEQAMEYEMLAKSISDYIRTLPDNARCAFIGRYYHLDSVKDIAKYCSMSEANVKVTLHRARENLRKYLKKEGFDI